eukprot:4597252-Pyramimonas_sp.AAC.1
MESLSVEPSPLEPAPTTPSQRHVPNQWAPRPSTSSSPRSPPFSRHRRSGRESMARAPPISAPACTRRPRSRTSLQPLRFRSRVRGRRLRLPWFGDGVNGKVSGRVGGGE